MRQLSPAPGHASGGRAPWSRLVDIRPGELRVALASFLVLFGGLAAHTMLETGRDALFLARLSAKGRLRLACIDFPVERCLEEVNIVMNPPALHVREFAPEEQIPGGRTLRFVEIDLAD